MTNKSESINELAKSLALAQGKIHSAITNADNPHFKYKYADLSSIWDACREPLSANGLAVTQTLETDDKGSMQLVSTLMHLSGQWISSACPVLCSAIDPQKMGSAMTYARRYGLAAIVGVSAGGDDDGQAATDRGGKPLPKAGRGDAPAGAPAQGAGSQAPATEARRSPDSVTTAPLYQRECGRIAEAATVQKLAFIFTDFMTAHKNGKLTEDQVADLKERYQAKDAELKHQ